MGRGRKKIDDSERKSSALKTRITKIEDDIITQYSAITKRSRSEFVRDAILHEIERCRNQFGIKPPNYDDIYYGYEDEFDDEDYENDDE